MPGKTEDEFLTTTEVAKILRVNVWTVKKMLAAGEFKGAFKVSDGLTSPWRIPKSAVERYISDQQKQRDRK